MPSPEGMHTRESPAQAHAPWAKDLLWILAAGLLIGFPFLGQERSWASREVRHALIVAEMAERGDYLIPTFMGEEYFYKQTVMHVPAALLCRATGRVSMWQARISSAVAGLLCACALYGLGLLLYDRRTALLAGLLLPGLPGYATIARTARPDMVFTCTLTLLVLGLAGGISSGARLRRAAWFVAAGLAGGLALLTKGPYGLFYIGLFSVLAVAIPVLGRRELKRPSLPEAIFFAGALAAVPLAWAIPVYLRDHGAYLGKVFGQYAPSTEHLRSPFWYIPKAALLMLPWTFLLPWVVKGALGPALDSSPSAPRRREWWSRARALLQEPAPWMALAVFAGLSAVPGKRDHYLGPWYPLAALAVAAAAARLWDRPAWRRGIQIALGLSLACAPLLEGSHLINLSPQPPYALKVENAERDLCIDVVGAVENESTLLCVETLGTELAFVRYTHGKEKALQVLQCAAKGLAFAALAEAALDQGRPCYLVVREKDLKASLGAAHEWQGELILEREIKEEDKDKGTMFRLYRLSRLSRRPKTEDSPQT